MAVVFPAPPLLLATATRIEPHPRPGAPARSPAPSTHRAPLVHSGTGAGVLTSTRTRVHTCTDERLGHLDALARADGTRPLGPAGAGGCPERGRPPVACRPRQHYRPPRRGRAAYGRGTPTATPSSPCSTPLSEDGAR